MSIIHQTIPFQWTHNLYHNRIFPDSWLWFPRVLLVTLWTSLSHFDQGSTLPHSSFWRISFAVETEHCKQLQQHAVEHDEHDEHDKLGFIIPRSVRINSAKFKVCLGHLNHMIPYYLLWCLSTIFPSCFEDIESDCVQFEQFSIIFQVWLARGYAHMFQSNHKNSL